MNNNIPRKLRKLAQIKSDIYFLRYCRHNNIIPNGLKAKNVLKFTLNCPQADELALKQSIQWLKLAINIQYRRLNSITCDKFFPLQKNLYIQYTNLEDNLFTKKRAKLEKLRNKKVFNMNANYNLKTPWGLLKLFNNETKNLTFVNNTTTIFPENICNFMQNGPSYTPKICNIKTFEKQKMEFIADVKYAANKLLLEDNTTSEIFQFIGKATEICDDMENLLKDKEKSKQIFTDNKVLHQTKTFLKGKNLVMTRSDKTKKMITIDNESYDNMLLKATLESGNFKKIKHLQPSTIQSKFNKSIKLIADTYELVDKKLFRMLNSCKCSDPLPNSPYVLPKDHKPGELKGRPVIAAYNGPTSKLSKVLVQLLRPLLSRISTNITNGDHFARILKSLNGINILEFGSFDVINLYGSLPLQKTENYPSVIDVVVDFFTTHKIFVKKLDFYHLLI